MNTFVLVTLPCAVSMVIVPVVAVSGTVAMIWNSALVASALLKVALTPLNSTRFAPRKSVPVSVMVWPG